MFLHKPQKLKTGGLFLFMNQFLGWSQIAVHNVPSLHGSKVIAEEDRETQKTPPAPCFLYGMVGQAGGQSSSHPFACLSGGRGGVLLLGAGIGPDPDDSQLE